MLPIVELANVYFGSGAIWMTVFAAIAADLDPHLPVSEWQVDSI
jgi:hypothetical protein